MKKLIIATVFYSLFCAGVLAQVGIGTNTPNASSILDLSSTNKAFIPPRMTTVQRNEITNPVAGMMIFNSTTTCIEIYRGTGWYNLCTGGTTSGSTITSVSPTSGAVGATVTITGTNLTGATVFFNGTAAVPTTVTATSITVPVPAGATTGNITVMTANGNATIFFTVSGAGLTSNDVAPANLIGHWTFDTDNKESISTQAAATAAGVVYTNAGKIGNCATFTNGYLVYNPIDLISRDTALKSYTISLWVNIPAGGTGILRSLFQITGNRFPDLWGNVAFELLNNGVPGDTLPLNARQIQVDGLAPYVHMESAGANYGGGANRWTFITQTYNGNGTNQTMKLYADGNLIQTQELTTIDKSPTSTQSTFRVVPTGGSPTPTPANNVYVGTMAFKDRGNIGGDGYGNFAPLAADRPWAAGSLTGKIDDIRIFNTALTAAEISKLFTRGTAGN